MKNYLKNIHLRHAGAMLMLAAVTANTAAQNYPMRPVRLLVPFPPGGATDIVSRIIAQKLNDAWGQTMVVDNRGGAVGNIAGELAAKAAPDGYKIGRAHV